jgi:transcriptional regulator with XRE-family HTH domain
MENPVSERFKKVRKALKLTQEAFSVGLKIKQSSVSTIETGGNPDITTLINIAIVYNVNLNWLIVEKGEMFNGQGVSSSAEVERWKDKYDELQRQLGLVNEELLTLYREKRTREEADKKIKKGA